MFRRDVLQRLGAIGTLAVVGSAPASARRRRNPCSLTDSGETGQARARCARPPGTGAPTAESRTEYVGAVDFETTVVSTPGDSLTDWGGVDVAIGDDGTRVNVRGQIWTSTPCVAVVLDDVSFDPGTQTLIVATREAHQDGFCAQVRTRQEYAASITMNQGTVRTVAVVHDGSTLTTDAR